MEHSRQLSGGTDMADDGVKSRDIVHITSVVSNFWTRRGDADTSIIYGDGLLFELSEETVFEKYQIHLYNIVITFLSTGPKRSSERTTGPRKMLPALTMQCNELSVNSRTKEN